MSTANTAGAAFAVSSKNNPGMYRLIYDTLEQSDGMTVDELSQLLEKGHQQVSSRMTYLAINGYVEDTGETRTTRYGTPAVVFVTTGKGTGQKIVCPIRQTQRDFILEVIETLAIGETATAMALCEERLAGLRR